MDHARVGQTIAIIPARYLPESGFIGAAHASIASGAAAGGLAGGAHAIALLPAGPIGASIAAAVIALGAVVEAGRAAAAATPEDEYAVLEHSLRTLIADLRPHERIARAAAHDIAELTPYRSRLLGDLGPTSWDSRQDSRALLGDDLAGAIEIRISRIGLAGWQAARASLFVIGEARLFDTSKDGSAWLRQLAYESPEHAVGLWLQQDAALMRAELERALQAIAERIVEDLVLSTTPTSREALPTAARNCGVELLDPKPGWDQSLLGSPRVATSAAHSLAPVLAWEALPPSAGSTATNPWARAKDLRYDLRIWSEVDGAPGGLVYERLELTETQHQIEIALEPASTYFWSVRLRGTVDGHPRMLAWSSAKEPPIMLKPAVWELMSQSSRTSAKERRAPCAPEPCGCRDFIPTENFFRFRTP